MFDKVWELEKFQPAKISSIKGTGNCQCPWRTLLLLFDPDPALSCFGTIPACDSIISASIVLRSKNQRVMSKLPFKCWHSCVSSSALFPQSLWRSQVWDNGMQCSPTPVQSNSVCGLHHRTANKTTYCIHQSQIYKSHNRIWWYVAKKNDFNCQHSWQLKSMNTIVPSVADTSSPAGPSTAKA